MKVIISIPAYNEEKDLGPVIREIKAVMKDSHYDYKILVYDDGSTDSTKEVAEKEGAIVFSNKRNLGLAETFKKEMEKCLELKAEIIVHTDADGQYPAKFIPLMIKKVQEGNDLVLGTRFGKGKFSGTKMKGLGNQAFAMALSGLLKMKLTDTTTGFRAFTPEVAQLAQINNFTYTQEQIIRAKKANMRIAELPITTKETRESRLFRSPFGYAIKAWINILRIYRDFDPLKFFGLIGGLFFFVGFVLGLWIIYSIITQGNAGGTPRVVLSAVFMLLGVQIVLFGFLADMNRK